MVADIKGEVVLRIRDISFFRLFLFYYVMDSRYPSTCFLWHCIIIVGCNGIDISIFILYYNSRWLWIRDILLIIMIIITLTRYSRYLSTLFLCNIISVGNLIGVFVGGRSFGIQNTPVSSCLFPGIKIPLFVCLFFSSKRLRL